jgi:anaerobic ribonucleoside-triphosphate reductase
MDKQDSVIEIKNEDRTVCEVWTRVMGYYRPTAAFNKGKKSEYQERKCFHEKRMIKEK